MNSFVICYKIQYHHKYDSFFKKYCAFYYFIFSCINNLLYEKWLIRDWLPIAVAYRGHGWVSSVSVGKERVKWVVSVRNLEVTDLWPAREHDVATIRVYDEDGGAGTVVNTRWAIAGYEEPGRREFPRLKDGQAAARLRLPESWPGSPDLRQLTRAMSERRKSSTFCSSDYLSNTY